jgi:hypothetical protein
LTVYLDTSVLLPLAIPEAASTAVRGWIETVAPDGIAISDWTITEFASALGLKVRTRSLTAAHAAQARQAFDSWAAEGVVVLTPTRADFIRAADYLGNAALGLRAGDALHLAVAANHGALPLFTLDHLLIAAGRKLRIKAKSPI